ncbi:hypothetical protein PAMP_003856 [Pampus punctatissimus]
MKDPISMCSYNQLYQNVKSFSKTGEYFYKELLTVFQQRAEMEHTYAKGLQKLAGKLIRASKEMANNSTYSAWCHVSDEMYSRADAHRSLGNAFQQEAILEIRQVLDEQNKRKRPLDRAVERTGKLVTANWSEQLKIKKKLGGITREHEALFNFVENNKHMCTEKEKQKMLNRLTKSAETQALVDEEYFNINMQGHQMRLKWENTLKNCYQIILELEKQRIEVLCNILTRYNLHMSSFGQTLKHGQRQIEQVVQRVDMDKDIQTLVEENSITDEDSKAEFLMADYFEEDSKSLMAKDRRKEAIKIKLQRLEDSIAKTKKDCEGSQTMLLFPTENVNLSKLGNTQATEQLLKQSVKRLIFTKATLMELLLHICTFQKQSSVCCGSPPLHCSTNDNDKAFAMIHSPVYLLKSVRISVEPLLSIKLKKIIILPSLFSNVTSQDDIIIIKIYNKAYTKIIFIICGCRHLADRADCTVCRKTEMYHRVPFHSLLLTFVHSELANMHLKEEALPNIHGLKWQITHIPATLVGSHCVFPSPQPVHAQIQ